VTRAVLVMAWELAATQATRAGELIGPAVAARAPGEDTRSYVERVTALLEDAVAHVPSPTRRAELQREVEALRQRHLAAQRAQASFDAPVEA
jgi:hypothetical protein